MKPKVLPQSVDLEEAVLGAILLEKHSLYMVKDKLSPKVFYKEKNEIIYKAICDLDDSRIGIDMFTVAEELKKESKLEKVGGEHYIRQLVSKVATAAHLETHALIILQQAARREVAMNAQRWKEQAFDDSVDVNDLISFGNLSIEKANDILEKGIGTRDFAMIVDESLKEYEARNAGFKEGKISGIETPLKDLDKATNGWQNSDLIIIAARPSMGKTALALQAIGKAVDNGYKPFIASLEMAGVRLADRILCGKADINFAKFRAGSLSWDEIEKLQSAAKDLRSKGITIDDRPGLSIEQIRSKAIQLHKEGKCDLLIIDYLQLVDARDSKAQNREREMALASAKSKGIAKELNIPVIALSQLNRAVELRGGWKRPKLADLRESGGIEQDADVVILLYRAKYYGFDESNLGEVIIAKHRNGKLGTIKFTHNDSLTRIYDYDESIPEELM